MRVTVLFTSLLLVLELGGIARAEVNPIYARLKAYRSYVAVEATRPMSHHFDLWFQDNGTWRGMVAGNTLQEMAKLEEDDLNLTYVRPPDAVEPVPPAVKHLADVMVARLRVLHPRASNIKVQYAGTFRHVSVREVIPWSPAGDPTARAAARTISTLRFRPDGTMAGTIGMSFLGAQEWLVHPLIPGEFSAMPRFIDHVMPPGLEGYSLLYAAILRAPKEEQALQALCARIVKTADEIDAGTYRNPIERVLEGQGESVLPRCYSTILEFTIDGYGRSPDPLAEVQEQAQFFVSTRRALAQPVMYAVRSVRTGLTYGLTVDLKARRVEYCVTGPSGKSLQVIRPLEEHSQIIVDGDAAAPIGRSIDFLVPEDEGPLTLPGGHGFSSFNVYPECGAWSSMLAKPEGAGIARLSKRVERSRRIIP